MANDPDAVGPVGDRAPDEGAGVHREAGPDKVPPEDDLRSICFRLALLEREAERTRKILALIAKTVAMHDRIKHGEKTIITNLSDVRRLAPKGKEGE